MKKNLLIASLFSGDAALLHHTAERLAGWFGPLDWTSLPAPFSHTCYYEREFGRGLRRMFVGFRDLVCEEELVPAKLAAIELERELGILGRRRVNIDPGILSLERLVLATHKNFTHRISLGRGIFADLTLFFQHGTFRPLPWTFPDYGSAEAIIFWNDRRKELNRRLKCQEA